MRSVFLVSLFAGLCCLSGSLQSQVKALPLHSRSPVQQFPRIFGLASKGMQDRVNVVLADREQMDLESRRDCLHTHLSQLRATYDETIRLTYLSSSLLSIDVRSTRIGCDAYPNIDMSYPLTIDLTSGKTIDWTIFFKEGFLDAKDGRVSPFTSLYLLHANLDKECAAILSDRGTRYDLWLNAQRGLMAKPSLPHVVQACAELVSIPFTEVQSAIRDPKISQELSTYQSTSAAHKPLP